MPRRVGPGRSGARGAHRMATWLPAETASPDETMALGRELATALAPGDIVALYGDLGAGKTHFAKGIAHGLGVDPEAVTSPTYTIVQTYAGRLPVHHIDAYRVERIEEFFELGYEEHFFGDGVTIIEWPERIEPLIPKEALRIRLSHRVGDRREIELAIDP